MIKRNLVRGVRKSAHLSRRVFTVGANMSSRVENKAHRIINGLDDTVKLHDKILFEKLYYDSVPYITPVHPALPAADRGGRVTILIPSLQKSSFFGGTATALIFAALMAQQTKMPLLVIETLKRGNVDKEALYDFFKSSGIDFKQEVSTTDISPRKYNIYGYIDIHPDDVFIASAWWDAHLLEQLPMTRKFIYLIQDYEPIFYANSDLQVLAENTYHSDKFVPVCNTKLMLTFMTHKKYGYIEKNGIFFEPAVNLSGRIEDSENNSGKKRLFLYGRPSVERNLFYTAIKALDECFTEQLLEPSDWECFMAGQDGISNILLEAGNEIKSLGKMNLDEYYKFASTIDLGVSLMMAPHPSYPPLELSSLGAAVVTTAYETKQDLSIYNDNLIISQLDIKDLKEKIVEASKIPRETRLKNARDTKLPNNWHDSLSQAVKQAIAKQ